MSVLDTLRAARELISDESRWTQHTLAVLATGVRVSPLDPEACQWCAIGAIAKCAGGDKQAFEDAALEVGNDDAVFVNDWEGHSSVLSMFDAAIARLESAEA